jgi:uncharacterized membrane protein YgcG
MLLAFSILVPRLRADERILDYHANIAIHKDSTIEVCETIRVRSEGARIKHGILRYFPTQYRSRLGLRYSVDFNVISVREGGQAAPYETAGMANGVRVLIGDPEVTIAPGEHTYELTYTVGHELGFFRDHDELYWNVTGNGWAFPIDSASADITLPERVAADSLKLTAYTGPQGSHAKDFRSRVAADGTIRFATTAPLGIKEGLTIVVGFPKGLVAEPTLADSTVQLLQQNMGETVGLAGLTLVLIYFVLVWLVAGRSPKRGAIVVRYDPPQDLSPAAIRYAKQMGYDDRAFSSAVLDLAVKGHLSIQQKDSSYVLTRSRTAGSDLPAEEQHLKQKLFVNKSTLELRKEYTEEIKDAVDTLNSDLKAAEEIQLFRRNRKWFVAGAILSAVTFIAMAALLPDGAGAAWGMTLIIAFWTIFLWAAIRMSARGIAIVALAVTGAAILAALVWAVGPLAAFVIVALLALNILFYGWLQTTTPEGRKLLDEIEGFYQFLNAVDEDRLKRLDAPDKTPELFEKLLPYAMALEVEQRWSQQFTSVLASAAAAPGGATNGFAPTWYKGGDLHTFSAGSFTDSFADSFSSVVSSASSPPGSSSGFDSGGGGSSSDGGSSGGGGGGGGGDGW